LCVCVCVSLRVTRRNSKPSSPAMSRWKMVGQRKEERKKERKKEWICYSKNLKGSGGWAIFRRESKRKVISYIQ